MEDVLTGDQPSRILQAEEEEQLQTVAPQYNTPPSINLEPATSTGGTLLIACGQGPAALLRSACESLPVAGSVTLPALHVEGETLVPLPHNRDRTAQLYRTEAGSDGSGVIIALCPDHIPAERSRAWAQAVLAVLQPVRVLALTVLLANEFVGCGDASEEVLAFVLESRAAAGSARRAGLAYLPSGNLVTGVSAALLTHGQLQGLPCAVLAAVQMAPIPDTAFMKGLATAAAKLAGAIGVGVEQLPLAALDVVRRACCQLDTAYISSAAASMYT